MYIKIVTKSLLLLIIFSFFYTITYGNEYKSQTVVVKFNNNFTGYNNWLMQSRSGEIEALLPVIGANKSKGFISNSNINLIRKRLNKQNNILISGPTSIAENLLKICVIEYEFDIDPLIASKKISTIPGIDYAEPLYIQHLLDIPNDSLVSFQSHLSRIKAFEAWDILDTNINSIIGIIDTGVDYLHEDLKDNLYINSGESGVDERGNDKRTNKLDDDSNGYIDDWMGWDFVSFDSIEGDNDPHPGNGHGTHVAGICAAVINNGVGIAGVAKKAKYLPVKVAPDEAFNTSVISGYDGIMYAAGMGANVINCSWGSSSKSEAEQEIIDAAVSLGSVVVAAAGNDGRNIAFYPSSHSSVLSVTAVDSEDKKAGFSNFHNTIDVSAPGVDIISTIPDNQYSYLSGTSMAAPVASGVAALVCEQYPEYKPIQIIQQIKSTTDNIDTLNPYLNGMLGTGRVNALKALTDSNIKSILVKSYKTEDNNDEIFDRGDTIRLSLSLLNVLRPVKDGWVKLSISDNNFIILKDNSFIGGMASLELRELADTLFFIVPDNIPADSKVMLEFRMFDDTSYCNSEFIEMTFRPTYKTMNANNITVTFNNIGNIGYNDYPNNNQGDGFKYKDSPNLMFEGALMVGTSAERLSNVARGLSQIEQDRSFQSDDIFKVFKNGSVAAQDGYSNFYDLNSVYDAGVSVSQKVYQFDDSISRDFILVVYDIINISGYDTDSLFASLFFDWDIGPSGSYNKAEYDNQQVFGYVRNVRDTSYPMVGASMLSSHKLNFYAIDNDGRPGIWDGFPRNEKWMFMSSGILQKESGITDVSMVIGAGPIKMMNGDTTRVTFCLFGGKTLDDLRATAKSSREKAISLHIADSTFNPLPNKDSIFIIYPNPTDKSTLRMDFGLTNSSYIKIEVIDISGKIIEAPVPEKYFSAGYYTEFIPVQNLSQGRYYLKLTTGYGKIVEPFEVVR